ncbi:tetratricopeptide repeat-containing sensor histidine kinase [Hugenholtzia roseola]|uniref:ATP-binding protein n=1 Tax=Hugenholtzia roseola TaxID=1002 RepID=UPI000478A30C|nr:tetratricopeptide repeat-containing sensor histidine kinase [Hugenholtzia roseola]
MKTILKFFQYYFLIGSFYACPFSIFGQNALIDSLQNILQKKSSTNFEKINIFNELSKQLISQNLDSALYFSQQAYVLSCEIEHENGAAMAKRNEAMYWYYKSEHKKGLEAMQKAHYHYQQVGDFDGQIISLNNSGLFLRLLGNLEEAILSYKKAILLYEKIDNKHLLFTTYTGLGASYQGLGRYNEAFPHFEMALRVCETSNDTNNLPAALSNLGNIFYYQKDFKEALKYYKKSNYIATTASDIAFACNNIGAIYLQEKQYDSAAFYLKKTIETSPHASLKLMATNNLGLTFYEQKQYQAALQTFEEARKKAEAAGDKALLAMIFNNLAAIYNKTTQYQKAIENAEQGLQIAKEINAMASIADNMGSLAVAYEALGDLQKALFYQKSQQIYRDSLFNIEKSNQIDALLLERKKLENERLEQENLLQKKSLDNERLEKQDRERELLILQKQAEADRLFAEAQQEKDKRKADSLYNQAQKAQLEAQNLKIRAEKEHAEDLLRLNEKETQILLKENEIKLRNNALYLTLLILGLLLVLVVVIYRQRERRKQVNQILSEKNEEISIQNEKLESLNQMKDQLFAIIAHDLRSPIIAFQGISKQIDFFLRKNKPERIQELGVLIQDAAENVNNLLTNLLNWALVQKGEVSFQPQKYDLYSQIDEIIRTYTPLSISYQVSLEAQLAPAPEGCFIEADPNHVHTILRNLVSNALKYTPESGKVSLKTVFEGKTVALYISDTGSGMPETQIKRLLAQSQEPNQIQSERGLRGEKGVGLGLNLCKEFANLNHIELSVESKLGEGTTFRLKFPIPSQEKAL